MVCKTDYKMEGKKMHTMAQRRRSNKTSSRAKKHAVPRTAEQFFAKSERSQDRWNQVTHVVTKMRSDGVSLRAASREFEVDPRTVILLAGPALRKRANGRYAAKRSDRLLRVLAIPTPEGLREVAVRDSRQASLLGMYWAAVQRYLATGDASALAQFRNKSITDASGRQFLLLTSLHELDRLGAAGVFSFESLYAKTA